MREERRERGIGHANATQAAVLAPPHRARKAPGADAAQQQRDLEQQMLRHLPPADAVAQLQDVMRDLAILHDSLRSLLSDSAPGHEAQHDQLVHFRGRVARRISRYAMLVRKSQALVDRLLSLQEEQLHAVGASPSADRQRGSASPLAPHASLPALPSLSSFLAVAPDGDVSPEVALLQREQLLQLQQFHQQNLQKFKSQLSAWWQRTERHFHTMRMVNYVNSFEATENQPPSAQAPPGSTRVGAAHAPLRGQASCKPPCDSASSQAASVSASSAALVEVPVASREGPRREEDGDKREAKEEAATLHSKTGSRVEAKTSIEETGGDKRQYQLRETRAVMAEELQRMQETQRQLQKSSAAIEQTESAYNVFGDRLASAKGILTTLKKRAETDSQLIWFAFLFFIGCCAFVVLRRLRVIRLAISTACLACSVFSGLLSSFFSTLGATNLQLQERLLSSAPLAPSPLPPALPSLSPPPFGQSDGVVAEKNHLLEGLPSHPPLHALMAMEHLSPRASPRESEERQTEEGRRHESSAAMEGEERGGQTLKARGDSPGSTAEGGERADDEGGEGDAEERDEGEGQVRVEAGETEERGDKGDRRARRARSEREEKEEREHEEGEKDAQGNNGDAKREK
ncbi:UNVERIFIED_CONTAM: Sec20 protein [Hammondia hammondi]|eukprot:XP_008889266.1 Sec20 protein [Hammondia hammondi]